MSTEKSVKSRLLDVVRKGAVPPPCDSTLHLIVKEAENGIARGQWEAGEQFINGNGVVNGGYISTAADIMMAYAVASVIDESKGFTSIDFHITFHRPAFQGVLDVEARVERLGRSVAYLVADLIQNDKKIASAVSSLMILNE